MSEVETDTITTARRWSMLALGVFAPTTGAMFTYGAAFLIPALQHERGLNLSQAGLVVAMPTIGLMLTLISWGALMDRVGERAVLVIGPGLLCVAGIAAAACSHCTPALAAALFVGGVGAASSNGASGRLIVGWFAGHRRGLAMGIRQGAQPLAVGLAAILIPNVANAHGLAAALLIPAVLSGVAALACGIGVIDPARPSAADAPDLLVNPYRKGPTLWRIHAVSVLLVVPQATLWTFALVWLHTARHWPLATASAVVMAAQFAGVFGRIGSGVWSDRVGSRMRPLRGVSIAAAVAMAALAATDVVGWGVAVPIMMIATVISVADNGLSFTAVAEIAGPYWSGRSLGIQNTGQNLASALLPPVFGALITAVGYPATFAVAAALATVAIPLVPGDTAETRRERATLTAVATPPAESNRLAGLRAGADRIPLVPDAASIGRYAKPLDAIHAFWNFVPEVQDALTELGLQAGPMCYFAARAGAMGPVPASVVAATFYNFNPDYVAEFVPRCWELADPAAVIAARYAGVDTALRRLLGADLIGSPDLAEAAQLAAVAASAAHSEGRPLFAAHAAVPWPESPHLVLWHALTLLREFRGDCHTAALLTAGLSGIEALVTHVATGQGFRADVARGRRGWSAQQWNDAADGLRARDLLDGDGTLTETGTEIREIVEDLTDDLAAQPWDELGDDGFARFVELAHPIYAALIAEFPRQAFAPNWSLATWPAPQRR